MKSRLVVFDLDNTLFSINTHHYFSDHFFKSKSKFIYLIYKILSLKLFVHLYYMFTKRDIKRDFSVYMFSFFSSKILDDGLEKIFKNLDDYKIDKTFNLLNKMKSKGYKVIVLSATVDFIAKYIANKYDIEIYSSIIKNGKYYFDMTGQKVNYVDEHFSKYEKYLFVSDNKEDINKEFKNYIYVYKDMYFKNIEIESFEC
ncbi:haloacid dehalogenase-like hydrolase [Hippea sp. KM1]|uniref:haloacid dehalogenase-like hydrolase n=1 Tax=Hippea sp. KM1 TaxID=944481 RepID=UPI00046C9ED3|nr:HAD family hydrolase [Hippea sp. KM1]